MGTGVAPSRGMTKPIMLWLSAGCLVAAAACKKDPGNAEARPGRIAIAVTEDGFKPDNIRVPKGQPVTLVFERKTDVTCAKDIVVYIDENQKVERSLPLNQPVEIAATFPRAGSLTYACSMDMVKGQIHVQ